MHNCLPIHLYVEQHIDRKSPNRGFPQTTPGLGDPNPGLDDPNTDGIVLIGEIGGTAEIDGAEFIRTWKGTHNKPVAAFVAGAAAPKGRKLGHAGAIVNSGDETADAKKEALRSAGVEVSDTIKHKFMYASLLKILPTCVHPDVETCSYIYGRTYRHNIFS